MCPVCAGLALEDWLWAGGLYAEKTSLLLKARELGIDYLAACRTASWVRDEARRLRVEYRAVFAQ